MNKRFSLFYLIFVLGILILVSRLFQLQIIEGKKNRQLADQNRIRKMIIPGNRGIIYDRKGKELVRNIPNFQTKINNDYKTISREEAIRLETEGRGDQVITTIGRQYVYGPVLAQVLGYLGEIDEGEIKENKGLLGEKVGRMGIEQEYENLLKGKDGGELVEVNALGEKIRSLGRVEPQSGQNLKLNLDADLSKVAYEALTGQKGTIIVSEAKTGNILVLVSSPAFNPEKIISENLTDPNLPFLNRAIAGVYPPGSTFKIITAASGLEENKISGDSLLEDTGEIRVGDFSYKNWYFTQYGKTEGKINLVRAIKRSTDTFFYQVGGLVGATKLTDWAKSFGLSKKTGIDLPGEVTGFVPDPAKTDWYLGNTYHLSIGQGSLLTTPLQINMMTGVIADDGRLCRPSVLKKETDCRDLKLKKETLDLIKEGMKGVCSSGGTAFPFFDFQPGVACKTGTAEFGDPQKRTHAWLTAFAPTDNPEIVVTVLVEAGGEGSYVAAPIAKKVMEEWFKK